MKLKEITYAILELIRNGSIVDDEKVDFRLLEAFIRSKRSDYIKALADSNKTIQEAFYQYHRNTTFTIQAPEDKYIYSINIPMVIESRFNPLIYEITRTGTFTYIPFKLVNNYYFKFAGNGMMNKNIIFATYRDNRLYIKSRNPLNSVLNNVTIKAIFVDPENIATFDVENMDYPITLDCYEYIKNEVLSTDLRILVSSESDVVNNANGDK